MRRIFLALWLIIAAPELVLAATVGDVCELKKPLKIAVDARGKGKKLPVKKGDKLTLVDVSGKLAKVAGPAGEGFVAMTALTKACTFTTPAPAAAVAAPDASTPSAGGSSPAPAESTPASAAPDKTAAAASVSEPVPSLPASPPAGPAPAGASSTVESTGGKTAKIRIAVTDLKSSASIAPDLVQSLTALVPAELDSLGLFKAISSQDISRMLSFEANRQLAGCDDSSCLAEVGGALGVDFIITGTITKVDAQYLLQLQLMNLREGRVEGRVARDYAGALSGLVEEVRVATRLVVRDLLATQSGALAVTVSEEGATIRVDGSIVGVSPLAPISSPGGTHTVTAEKEGFVRLARDVDIKSGGRTAVSLTLLPSGDFIKQYQATASGRRLVAWTTLAAGVVGLGTGAGLYVLSGQQATKLNQRVAKYAVSDPRSTAEYDAIQKRDKAIGNLELGAVVGAGVGLVAVGVGVFLLVTGDDPHRYDASATVTSGAMSFGWAPLDGGGTLLIRAAP